ncbi:unnamed protein product [Rotaria sordida]|uniref:ADP ribosyltransferase domain-containing protein n=1 Tax=Rotaria sordida TaxID=392033 RepID=A0A819X318_9BILA|nr:unnamed protein product [Rotaria sordida]CAF1507923.1 unnamed protein product [Rotaria sordida]CAF3864663.1 unnamed protein product [Rotaria sordida]CAF4133712.1 unnamed protein product [Rotaria sordida]
MSAAKPKPKAGASSVSKLKSTTTVTTSKTSDEGASSSKPHPLGSTKSEKHLHTTTPVVKDSAITQSTAPKPSKFYFACRNNDIDTVTSLLPTITLEGINQIEPNGSTALHAAAYYGNKEIVKLLLSKGTQRMIKNVHGNTPYDEAKTGDIKKLFQRVEASGSEPRNRFAGVKGPSYEWIFVKSDPSSYASFNRESLWKCQNDEEFDRLCRGIQQYYINENGPLADVKHIESVRLFIDTAIKNNDPTQVVRAYTAETGFYHRVNTDLAQIPTHWSGTKHERNIASIMVFHPVLQGFSFTGETYRGMSMSLEDLKDYVIDSIFMNKTFLSTSKERTRAELFAEPNGSSAVISVVCKYLIKRTGTALAIEEISEYPLEKEVLILPYASFKVKNIRKSSGKAGVVTEIDVEEEDEMKWTMKKSYNTSQTHTSVKKIVGNQSHHDDTYKKMFKDSQEKGKIDSADLSKWKQESFGIDPETDAYAKIWNDAKKGKFSKTDLAKWKKECSMVTEGNHENDSDLESYDGENDPTIFTASNEQSYATSKTLSSKHPFDMKEFMTKFENDSDD